MTRPIRISVLASLLLIPSLFGSPLVERAEAIPVGDTLTVIQRPLLNIPAILRPGDSLDIQCDAAPGTSGWQASLLRGTIDIPLGLSGSSYDSSTEWWTVTVTIPPVPVYELYDLEVTANGGIQDVTTQAVKVIADFKTDYYFIHITDPHLPTHLYYYQSGADTDSSEIVDLREVIGDINLINPEFVLITGDYLNEGELEDYLSKRYYTRGQKMLTEFEVPTYLTAGNHDLGGWDDTPPSDGTARRDWWRFFGWKRLDDPPPGAPWHTQNYSFDYGSVHYVGLEAYLNYDNWRFSTYGYDSFTSGQMEWLSDDLDDASGSDAEVLFYHRDFGNQINLNSLGVDMALSGHIHRDEGSITSAPYDLATDNLCDGARKYRLVRVSDGTVQPTATLAAGGSGNNLRIQYSPSNDGTADSVAATITNNQDERFEHGLVRFRMPATATSFDVTGGSLLQTDESESVKVCHVAVDILANDTQIVTIAASEAETGVASGAPPAPELEIGKNQPNPFNPATSFTITLPRAGQARLSLFDVRGREVVVFADEELAAGIHPYRWDGTDTAGDEMASGIYFARLLFGDESRTRKIVLAR